MKRPKPGEKVILTCARPELFADLPVDNQKAICDIAGKPVLLKSYDSQGRAELQFTDSLGGIHFLHVEPTEIKAARDFISYVAYRRISLLLAVLFVFFAPLFLGFAWISDHWFKSDKPLLVFGGVWLAGYVLLTTLHRLAKCPCCGMRLGVSAPFTSKCGKCKSALTIVEV